MRRISNLVHKVIYGDHVASDMAGYHLAVRAPVLSLHPRWHSHRHISSSTLSDLVLVKALDTTHDEPDNHERILVPRWSAT